MKPNAVIFREGEMPFVLTSVKKAFENETIPTLFDNESVGGCELVLGDTSREISKKAKALLD